MAVSSLAGAASSSVNKDELLKLFVAQLKNQSPMDPLKGHEFVAQLAQFTSLEQLTNLNTSFAETFKFQQLFGGGDLIGKRATYFDTDSNENAEGIIQGAMVNDGSISVVIENREIPISDITGVF